MGASGSRRLMHCGVSAGEPAEKRSQLGGDTKNGTFDDADNGGEETHENTSLSADASCRSVQLVAAPASYSSTAKLASSF